MKKLKNLAKLSIILILFSSCQKESVNQNQINQENAFGVNKIQNDAELYKNSESLRGGFPFLNFSIRVESDLVNADSGCYTVNVRVYVGTEGEEYLVANEDVEVGDCGGDDRMGNKSNGECEGRLPNGDLVIDNGTTGDRECLYDLLIQNDEAYRLYLSSVDKTINGN